MRPLSERMHDAVYILDWGSVVEFQDGEERMRDALRWVKDRADEVAALEARLAIIPDLEARLEASEKAEAVLAGRLFDANATIPALVEALEEVERRALALQAAGPDEFPFGYYMHLALATYRAKEGES